jgi:hypothetical protein
MTQSFTRAPDVYDEQDEMHEALRAEEYEDAKCTAFDGFSFSSSSSKLSSTSNNSSPI